MTTIPNHSDLVELMDALECGLFGEDWADHKGHAGVTHAELAAAREWMPPGTRRWMQEYLCHRRYHDTHAGAMRAIKEYVVLANHGRWAVGPQHIESAELQEVIDRNFDVEEYLHCRSLAHTHPDALDTAGFAVEFRDY